MDATKLIQVCDKCLTASCWYGEFMCDEARHACLTVMTIQDLRRLNLEHEENWSDEKMERIYGDPAPFGSAGSKEET